MAKIGLIQIFLLIGLICSASARREETLDPNGNYVVGWEVDLANASVTFDVTVRTIGYVGFGISNGGGMLGADIIIGGLHPNGTSYFDDYHALGEFGPIRDNEQNWELLSASENSTHTKLSFSRLLNTCDEQDTAITNDTTNFIWSFGPTDRILYHGPNRGSSAVNVLDPPMPDLDFSKFEKWTVNRTMEMPAKDTSYWCTTHKMPKFEGRHHVVAFKAELPTIEAQTHTHHFVIYKCTAPEGVDPAELFDPYVAKPGGECYEDFDMNPIQYCNTILYVWAVGGKPFVLPDNVGYPVNENGVDEYVMLEIHYDNPDVLSGIVFDAGVEIYHTPTIRQYDAGLLMVAHQLIATHMIPPKSPNFVTVGHCSPQCTLEHVPSSGINVFNAFLHSHLSGRKLTVRQFRNGNEVPWLANDANYNFNFQQNRPLRDTVQILPGDHLSYECQTDTTWREGVTLAGLSTRHEMCEAFLWYYPKQDFHVCSSYYLDAPKLFNTFGIQAVDWTTSQYDPTVTAPFVLAGKTFSEVLNAYPWTDQLKQEIQNELRFGTHWAFCNPNEDLTDFMGKLKLNEPLRKVFTGNKPAFEGFVTYPAINSTYIPPNPCQTN